MSGAGPGLRSPHPLHVSTLAILLAVVVVVNIVVIVVVVCEADLEVLMLFVR